MGTQRQVPRARSARHWPTLGDRATLALACVLFAGVFALRESDSNVGDAEGILYVVPIAVLALRYGLCGGVVGALLSTALIAAWDLRTQHLSVTASGYLSRGVAFLVLGVLLGIVVDHWRRLQAAISRYYDASPDMLATLDRTGRFTRVNPAWERTLGHSAATMCSRPFINFVHPDDRDATVAEAVLVDGDSGGTIGFRNRYRTAAGDYRWLQWNTSAPAGDGAIHAVARDISAQRDAEQQLADSAAWLEAKVAERTAELDQAHAETLWLLALAAEYRDDDTARHTERVGVEAAAIAAQLGLGEPEVKLMRDAAPLHDIGKLAIPDRILLKRGRLDADEYDLVKTHAALGARLLSGTSSPVLQRAAVIAGSHHEWWDGTGYPGELANEAIPLAGRIVAVADAFDALTQRRPYKGAWSARRAIAEIDRAAGSQFDPRVVAAFLALHADTADASASGTTGEDTGAQVPPRARVRRVLPRHRVVS